MQIADQLLRIEPFLGREQFQARNLRNHHGIGISEGVGQFLLENIAARRVGARLEDGPDLFASDT